MKSEQFEAYGAPLTSHDYGVPLPIGTEVIIKVTSCGVCHSDVHVWEGYFDLGGGQKVDMSGSQTLPFTLGHEIAGEVVAVGDGVTGIAPGEKYVVYPWIGCGKCHLCASGKEHLCSRPRALGITVDGGFSTHVVVPDAKYLFPLKNLSPDIACTYACSGVTAYSAINQVKDLAEGNALLIIGAGGVGLSGLAMAKALTNCHIVVADISEEKRALALASGADEVLDPLDPAAVKALQYTTKGGVAAAVDFVGSDKTAALGIKLLAKGGKLVVVGLFGGAMTLSVPMLPLKAITICGSYVGSLQDMAELMELVYADKVVPIKVSCRPLDCAHEALEDLRDGKVNGRVVLKPE